MMSQRRLRLSGVLDLETDLHIGASQPDLNPAKDQTSEDRSREVSFVLKGVDDRPVVPGSSLKGVLRALLTLEQADRVFGQATNHDTGHGGTMAQLWLDNALLIEPADEDLFGLSADPPKDGRFLKTGVALDAHRGAAADNQLFTKEFVAKGATFQFAAIWFSESCEDLLAVLAILSKGIRLGAATSKGNGRVKLDLAQLRVTEETIDAEARNKATEWSEAELTELRGKVAACQPVLHKSWERFTFTLTCDGPFLSIRSSEKENGRDIVKPLMRDGKPLFWREGLRGALRTQARWLAEVSRTKGDIDRPKDIPMDDRFLEHVLDGRRFPKPEDKAVLSAVERLFGVTGLKGSLEVTTADCTRAGTPQKITSNSLDRISGGGRDGFLFTEEVTWGVTLKVELHLQSTAAADERTLLFQLLDHIAAHGLELGHGAAKGFGWFDVTLDTLPDRETAA